MNHATVLPFAGFLGSLCFGFLGREKHPCIASTMFNYFLVRYFVASEESHSAFPISHLHVKRQLGCLVRCRSRKNCLRAALSRRRCTPEINKHELIRFARSIVSVTHGGRVGYCPCSRPFPRVSSMAMTHGLCRLLHPRRCIAANMACSMYQQ